MNPLEELKVSQLKAALKERGADTRDSKFVLMIRLTELLNDRGVGCRIVRCHSEGE